MNKSKRQHPTMHQLYGHLPPITKTIQVRWTRHAGNCWRSRDELKVMYFYGPPHMTWQKQDGQLERTRSSSVRIRDLVLKTWQRRWTTGRNGERGSGISVLAARHDDDDDDIYIYIYIYIWGKIFVKAYLIEQYWHLCLHIFVFIFLSYRNYVLISGWYSLINHTL